ncbi:MAG: hypothetical protein ACRENN_02795, partial [Candidatus Eiseniibacteriota bacterium]
MRRIPIPSSRLHGPKRALSTPRASWALLASILLTVPACGTRPFAEGSSRELVVLTSLPADAPEILMLRAVVEREALRIDHEASYVVRLASPSDASAYRSTLVLVVGSGPYDRIPKPCAKLRARLERGDAPYAFVPDSWLRGQAAGIVWAKTRDEWISAMARAQNPFYLALDRATFGAVRERVLALPRDERAERILSDAVGFSIRVPRGYTVQALSRSRAALVMDEGPPARLLRVQRAAGDGDMSQTRAALARLFRPHEETLPLADPMLVPDEMAGARGRFYGRWEDSD